MKGTPLGGALRHRAVRASVGSAVAAIALAGASQEAAASRIEVTKATKKGEGSFAWAARRANSDSDLDRIVFAARLRGTIRLPRDVLFEDSVVLEGRGYGEHGRRSFGRVVLRGPRSGVGLKVERRSGPRLKLRELYLDRVSVSTSHGGVVVEDSFITGRGTSSGAGVYAGYGYDEVARLSGSTVTGFDRGFSTYRTDGRIEDSTISSNRGSGGVQVGSYSFARITGSTITGNVAEADGALPARGAGVLSSYESAIEVVNSTISGNVAEGEGSYGGGVVGAISVNASTITGNRAESGGGVSTGPYYGPIEVTNSIVAGNESTDPADGEDCAGDVRSQGGNLIESPGTCSILGSDLSGVDPQLAPLAANGGPTRTHALGKGSPAIGLARRKLATKFDQRGARRGSNPDSGAYERGEKR